MTSDLVIRISVYDIDGVAIYFSNSPKMFFLPAIITSRNQINLLPQKLRSPIPNLSWIQLLHPLFH